MPKDRSLDARARNLHDEFARDVVSPPHCYFLGLARMVSDGIKLLQGDLAGLIGKLLYEFM